MSQSSKLVEVHKDAFSAGKHSQNRMRDYVVNGAKVFCSRGTKEVHMVFSNRGYTAGYGEIGLDVDTLAGRNFSDTFGFCKCINRSCCPSLVNRWVETGTRQVLHGAHPLLVKSMIVCTKGGIIYFKDNGQNSEKQSANGFELPPEYRAEIEAIIASEQNWDNKADLIGRVYERYLYMQFQDAFDVFAKACGRYERTSSEFLAAEEALGKILHDSNIDIREVARAMSRDMLRVVPKGSSFAQQLYAFYVLERPRAPADLKARALFAALGMTDNAAYEFSIWSRKWEPDMRKDYMGNYLYGYNGGAYFDGFDFDNVFPSEPLITTPFGAIGEKPSLIRGGIEALREANPDKTDTEMLLLLAAGGAQLMDDKDLQKYISSFLRGDWGDNAVDSAFSSEGINDYYRWNGIDKAEVIQRERKE